MPHQFQKFISLFITYWLVNLICLCHFHHILSFSLSIVFQLFRSKTSPTPSESSYFGMENRGRTCAMKGITIIIGSPTVFIGLTRIIFGGPLSVGIYLQTSTFLLQPVIVPTNSSSLGFINLNIPNVIISSTSK